jgi:hypothetical protein
MLIAVDFDGTIVSDDRPFEDTVTPLRFLPGAKEGLLALRRAGHTLILWSARTNRATLFTPEWDPLVRAGIRKVHLARWEAERPIHWARLRQMKRFLTIHLPRVFAVVDDGLQGKPCVDMFIDDKALRYGFGADAVGWNGIAMLFGEPRRLTKETANVRRSHQLSDPLAGSVQPRRGPPQA